MLEVHRLRHLEWKPTPVVALAESVDGSSVAAARESGAIEIWNVAPGSVGWHCELTLPGRKDAAISSIAWCSYKRRTGSAQGRLFSAGLSGFITEWDLETLQPKVVVESYGGPVWQLAFEPAPISPRGNGKLSLQTDSRSLARHRESRSGSSDSSDSDVCGESDSDEELTDDAMEQRLAVACDDGSVRLFTVNESKDAISYRSSFPRVKGRILSVAWHSDGSRLYAGGSDGCIRCWDTMKMHEVYRIAAGTGGLGSSREICVWSLLVLRDSTIVSGDSSGSTQFWDAYTGALLKSHTVHRADVLSLAAAPSHKIVFSAGADGQVILYQLVEESKRLADKDLPSGVDVALGLGSKWEFVGGKRTHLHDVRALAVACPCAPEEEFCEQDLIKKKPRKKLSRTEQSHAKWQKRGIPMLVSGGNDAKLFAYPANAYLDFYPHDVSPAPERMFIQLAHKCYLSGATLVMAQHTNWIDIWKVSVENSLSRLENGGSSLSNNSSLQKRKRENPKYDKWYCHNENSLEPVKNQKISHSSKENGNGNLCHILGYNIQKGISKIKGQPPSLLARIKAKAAEHISCSAISGNGRFLAFSDQTKPRLYELQQGGDESDQKLWGIKKLQLPAKLSPAHSMIFSDPLMHLILACHNHEIHVIDAESAELLHTFHLDRNPSSHIGEKASPITMLRTSFDGQWLAACSSSGDITVLNLETCRHHWSIPLLDGAPPTAIEFHPGNLSVMIVSTAGNHIHVLDVEARALTEWSKMSQAHVPPEISEFPGGITGLSVPFSSKSTSIIAYSPKAMCFIDLRKPFGPQHDTEVVGKDKIFGNGDHTYVLKHRSDNGDMSDKKSKCSKGNFNITTFDEPVLFVGHVSERSLLVVECPWSEVLLGLPAPVFRHTYGT
ncbi:hypothetical protein O6H91_13G056600 [Diphasiastrum complanatum]|uniref:Uncharacterized protein n=3 Tax=Diphasiastrum complanatum TaxID=34168 RepID=A0ACC2BV00_DIPCM|nr:hypothetical protein O6H91_13G056600 [Diphasiastrum complanatum]KAJ7533601.1 hypothetical protein O6H91_13G056600 [Diphasiastrum complanatum]KAJ7533602.1 hypothetical protein O6H91_13G056600 [Diphasiastrum complanatum]